MKKGGRTLFCLNCKGTFSISGAAFQSLVRQASVQAQSPLRVLDAVHKCCGFPDHYWADSALDVSVLVLSAEGSGERV